MTQLNDKRVEHFKPTSRCLLTLVTLIFVFSATAFALTQISADTTELATRADKEIEAKVVRILLNNGEWRQENDEQPKKLLQQNDTVQLLTTAIKEEKSEQQHIQNKRDAPNNNNTNNNNTNNNNNNNQIKNTKQGYYEEQQPVIVHAESLPTLGRRQNDYGDPQAGYEDPYYARSPTIDDDDDNEYEGEQFEQVPVHYPYQQQSSAGYYSDAPAVAEKNSGSEEEPQSVAEGRAAQNYDSYYRQPWLYATPAPVRRPNGGWEVGDNRKMHTGESDPYDAYDATGPMDDYEYPGALTPFQKQQLIQQQQQQQEQRLQKPQIRPQQTTAQQQQLQVVQGADPHSRPSTNSNGNTKIDNNSNSPSTENSLLSTLKSLKTMWDIYQAFSAAWNMLATHRQKQEQEQQEAVKRRQQQIAQQMRINSKKPPKFSETGTDKYTQRNNSSSPSSDGGAAGGGATIAAKRVKLNNKANKNPKPTTTTTTTTMKSTAATELEVSSEAKETVGNRGSSSSNASGGGGVGGNKKAIGTKGEAMARQNAQGKREKRQMSDTAAKESTDVAEGRYIKGDPLKGYYDFVITEGSYKFWAVFQTGTALLIIYSTFAAIYYSKVNPLVSDYDYTDYLGGARSLSGGDDDFIDDDDDSGGEGAAGGKLRRRSSWLDGILPRTGRTLQYILDALDKLPVDHREADEAMKSEHLRVAETDEPAVDNGVAEEVKEGVYEDDDATTETGQSVVGGDSQEELLESTQRQLRAIYAA